jgi:type IV pilus assembly protein PilC
MVTGLREALAYPMLAIHMSLIILIGISRLIAPEYLDIIGEFQIRKVPALTTAVIQLGLFVDRHFALVCGLYLICLAFSIWLFMPGLRSHRVVTRLVSVLPGSLNIASALDSARLCRLIAIFIQHSLPLDEALQTSAGMVDHRNLQDAILRVAERSKSGHSTVELLASEAAVDDLIVLTLRGEPGATGSEEFHGLADLFEHRAALALKSAQTAWTAIAVAAMSICVGTVIIALFNPLISLVKGLS